MLPLFADLVNIKALPPISKCLRGSYKDSSCTILDDVIGILISLSAIGSRPDFLPIFVNFDDIGIKIPVFSKTFAFAGDEIAITCLNNCLGKIIIFSSESFFESDRCLCRHKYCDCKRYPKKYFTH